MNVFELFKKITTFIFDMDGVLTDGSVLVLNSDQQLRRMHVKDGLGLQMALKNGYRVLIISGGNSEQAKERLVKLGITDIQMSLPDKKEFVSKYVEQHSLDWSEILFMGDDLPDYELMKAVGVSCCPADAVAEIKQIATYISHINGGYGCVRDVIEKVLKVKKDWHYEKDIVSK